MGRVDDVDDKPAELQRYLDAREAKDRADSELDAAREALMELMSQEQQKTYRWGDEEHPSSVTYSLRGVPTINEPALRKELGAKVYDKYTKRVLDRKAMERAMDMGLIDPVTVSKHVSMTYTRVLTFREK